MKKKDLLKLEQTIGYSFNNTELIEQAFCHKSYINECMIKGKESYERIEFLGDAILEYIVSEYLFQFYSKMPEGELTKLRASLVCEFTLSKISRTLFFGDYIKFSKGEYSTGGPNRDSILCDVFESVLGAIYLDGGIDNAKKFVNTFLLTDIEHKQLYHDSKTKVQEYMQKHGIKEYGYELISEEGPEHNKIYTIKFLVNGKEISRGSGHNKKSAEQEAAYIALKNLCE